MNEKQKEVLTDMYISINRLHDMHNSIQSSQMTEKMKKQVFEEMHPIMQYMEANLKNLIMTI
jgi:hypothetical protein